MNDAYIAALCIGAVVIIVALSEVVGRLLRVPGRITRLAVHVASGVLVAVAPLAFQYRWWPAGIALFFITVLLVARYRNWLPSIHAVRPSSYGTVWFALAVVLLYLSAWAKPVLITIPLLVMAFADTAGVIVGEARRGAIPLPEGFAGKSWDGSMAVFAVTGLTVSLGWEAFGLGGTGHALLVGLACAPVAAVVEALSPRGTDNVTLPLSMAVTLVLLSEVIRQPQAMLLAEVVALVLVIGAVRWRALRPDGAAGVFLMATWLLGGGGWPWTMPLIVFFILSSILSRASDSLRPAGGEVIAKGSVRDLTQVAANGGIALAIFFAASLGFPLKLAWPAFLGAVATAASDTWATEIGMGLRRQARLITTGRRVPAGTSGGVTLVGSGGGVAGALLIGIIGWILAPAGVNEVINSALAALVGGLGGCLADSCLGATVQIQFRCCSCGAVTERRRHCDGAEVERIRGWRAMDNDVVNAVSGLVGAAVALLTFAVVSL